MNIEALNCPNCGAGVASDSTLCRFCKTRLKTVACPKCFGLMFVGARFCGRCGAMTALVEVSLRDDTGECPRCRRQMNVTTIGGARLCGCARCDGVWMDVTTFENVCADREDQEAVLGHFEKRSKASPMMTKITYVPCPDCGKLMNRNNFAKASGVIVDMCKQHGVWFDADELPAIIEFIRKGGMKIAREREKNDLRDERQKLRDEQRKQANLDQRYGTENTWKTDESDGIRGFVQRLFE